MVQISWTSQAVADLKSIVDFISLDSEYCAKRQLSKFILRTQSIRLFIRISRIVPELQDDSIRELIEGQYRIVYKFVSEDRVAILTVHHSSLENLSL